MFQKKKVLKNMSEPKTVALYSVFVALLNFVILEADFGERERFSEAVLGKTKMGKKFSFFHILGLVKA